jgi:hypothetical protein
MPKGQEAKTQATKLGGTPISKYPTWTVLPQQPISYIHADHRIETDVDALGVGRVRVKPGYDVNIEEIRYGY